MSAMSAATKTLVIGNGTLIDGSGKPSSRNDIASLTKYIGRKPAHAARRS
jgi:hypothetical protein